MKRLMPGVGLLVALLVALLGAVFLFQLWWEPGSDQRAVPVAYRGEQVRQGAYLARAGNCMACHTARGGAAYAGGRAIATPFGTMYGPNLTPDSTGLGAWSADDFWRAMHNGKSKDGRFLYPAFPYPNYTRVTRADSDALYAFLRTLAPVKQPNREHALRFPYNQRPLLAFWRTLYFSAGEYVPEPARGALWNRGAYLAQGLGHCSACHAPRNALGASLGEKRLGGADLAGSGWHAPALGPGAGGDVADLTELLHTGVSARKAVAGPMAEVVGRSLQHLTADDVGAMAHYLVSLPAVAVGGEGLLPPAPVLRQGGKLYTAHCASCHGDQGEGSARSYPALVGSNALGTSNAIRLVLGGGYAPSTAGNPRPYGMPPFAQVLSDAEVAAVLAYAGASWGNRAPAPAAYEVERLRTGE